MSTPDRTTPAAFPRSAQGEVLADSALLKWAVIRETSHSLIEIALEVGYTSPSHFAQVFRRDVGVTPTEYRGRE